MPLYTFESTDSQTQDIFYTMAEVPRLGDEIEIDGVTWKRVFTKPNAAITTQGDPYSSKAFNAKLDGKKVTVGDMWDASREASEKRGGVSGEDPIKKTYYDNYAKERRGVKHQNEQKAIYTKQMEEVQKEIKKILPT